MSARFGSASPQSLFLLFVQCVSLFFLLIYVAAQQTNAEQQLQQKQQQQQQQQQQNQVKAPNNDAVASIDLHQNLRFEPAIIDFGQWAVGTAHSHTVTLINQHLNRSVLLNSVSGRTPSFYSSFFEHKIIAPQSNTTFQVVFLPRENGEVDTELFIHSSFGQAKLAVRGVGRECPYRLKPLTGIKAPLNATLTPEINMYNPHDKPLQILEIYSSGGQFQLELPSGGLEGPQALWAIPAYTEKPIIRIRFHARNAGNFSAYIRIKISTPTDNENDTETVLVIPVEFEILAQTGLYAANPILDFGRLSTDNAHRANAPKIKLQLKQSNEQRPHDFLGFNMRILAGLIFDPADNSIILDPRKFNQSIILDELVLLRAAYKRNISALQEFSVRLRAHIFKGSLHYKQNITTFLTHLKDNTDSSSGSDSETKRQLIVHNNFQVPLAVFNVSVIPHLDSNIFNLQLMPKFYETKQILQPGSKLNLLQVSLLNHTLPHTSKLLIHTNISMYEIPLAVCSGRLHVTGHNVLHIPLNVAYNATLHLGAIPNVEISHQGWVVLINRNPTGINLKTFNFESPPGFSFQVAFMGCVRNVEKYLKHEPATIPIEHVEFRFCNHMAAGDVVIYEVALQEYMAENRDGTLNIWTPYEHIKVNVKFHSWKGKIELVQDKVNFPNCFPGKVCTSDIYIISGLPIAIELGSVEFNNDYFKFKNLNHTATTIIQPRTVTKIGRVYFEAHKICPTRCYIPPYDRLTNKRIAFPGPRPNKNGDSLLFDELELRRRTELFRQLKWYLQTVVFTLTTRKVYHFQIAMSISSEWPKLVRGGRQALPLLEVGKPYIHNIVITNPADVPILVDYFMSDQRSPNAAHLSLPLEVMDLSASCLPTNKPVFSLNTAILREPLLIPPNGNISLPIRFESNEVDSYCTLLHLRNNLTLYEPVWISAKTVQPQFRFGNRKPGNTTPMMFDIKDAHLAACHEEFPALPLVAVKRSFTARNAGELPIFINSFQIGEHTCEGHGFKVLDCQGFELKANSSRKIEISFTPDFTLSRIQRPLILHTNLSSNKFHYELLATLPAVNLDMCSRKLPRPAWEKSVRNAVMMLLASTFIFVILATHIDFTNIMHSQTLLYNVRQRGPIYPTFNLRNIMQRPFQVRNTSTEENENNGMTDNNNSKINSNNGNGAMPRRSSLNEQTNGANYNNNSSSTAANNNNNNNSGGNNNVRRRGRKSGITSNSPAVGIGRNMSLTTTNALEAGLLQNLIIMSNNPNDNRVIVVAPKRRDSTPSPVESPIKNLKNVQIMSEAALLSPTTSATSTTWPSTPTDSEPPSPLIRNNEFDKENDRESGISISSTTSAEMDTSSLVKKKQQQLMQQHVSRSKRSKLLAQDKKAEKEREREKLRERQLEKEREREKLKLKEQEKEKQKEREREKREREREQRYKEQLEKQRLEKEEQEKERLRQKEKEAAREKEKEREREKERIKKLVESEKQKTLEKEQEKQRQLERKMDLEQKETEVKQREKLKELERQKEMEQKLALNLERENERKLKLQKEAEKERVKKAAELEREKQKELKKQREKELELERERQKQKEVEREKERKKEKERQKERQKELEKERKKEKEILRKNEKSLKASTETLEGSTKNALQKETNCKITEKEKNKKLLMKDNSKDLEIKVEEKDKATKNMKISKEETEKPADANVQTKQDDKDLTPPLKTTPPAMTRKYGKTPGRERRKDGTNIAAAICQDDVNNHLEKKNKQKAVQSLLFDALSPPVAGAHKNKNIVNGSGSERTSPNCLARSPWETGSQVSLRDLIQKPQPLDFFNRSNTSLTENVKNSAATSPQNTSSNNNNNNNANELGPIGSRKSPSSTPLWESVQKPQQPEKPLFPKPIITNNSSFFSNLPGSGSPNLNSFGLGDGQFMGIPTNLYELQKVQMELQRQLQTNEFIINLHQQQQRLQQQQELLQGAGDIAIAASAAMVTSNQQWSTTTTITSASSNNNNINVSSETSIHSNNSNFKNNMLQINNSGSNNNNNNNNSIDNGVAAWSPMGYRQAVDLNLVNNVNNNQNIQQVGQSSNSNNTISQNGNIMGLCINNNGLNNSGGTETFVGLAPWQQLGLTRPPPGLNASPNNLQQRSTLQQAHFQSLQQQQEQSQQSQQQQQQQPEIQQFDPFKSLSSIWSDNWNRNGSK